METNDVGAICPKKGDRMKDKLKEMWIYKTETAKWTVKKTIIQIPNEIVVLIHFCLLLIARLGAKLLKILIIGYCFFWFLGIANDLGWVNITPRQAFTMEMHIENMWNVFRWWCEMQLLKFIDNHVLDLVFNWIYDQFDKVFAYINRTSTDNYYRRIEKAKIDLVRVPADENEVQ